MNTPVVPHLMRRSGRFYYRFVRTIDGRRTEIKGSLKTSDYPTALQRLAVKEAEIQQLDRQRADELPEIFPNPDSEQFNQLPPGEQYNIRRQLFVERAINFYVGHHAKGGFLKKFMHPQAPAEFPSMNEIQNMFREVLAEHDRKGKSKLTLEQAISQYMDEKKKTHAWSKNFSLANARVFERLTGVLKPETNIGEINRKAAVKFVDWLNAQNLQNLSFNQYITITGGLFEWLRKNQEIDLNPFEGLRRKNAVGNKQAFSREQVREILSKSEKLNAEMRRVVWIGAYCGLRVGEICSLRNGDICVKDGVAYIDVNGTGEEKSLKTLAAKRKIPMNDALTASDLVAYAEGMADDARLFPSLNNQIAGQAFRHFLADECGIESKSLTFHSLRHTWKTELTRAGANDRVISQCGGWARRGDAGERSYYHGLDDLKFMLAELNKLKF